MKKPGTILRNVNGIFTDGVGTIVSFEDAVGILEKRDSYVIKPAFYSGGGRDIYFHVAGEGDIDVIDTAALLNSYKSDYICQNWSPSSMMACINHPQSANTVRIISIFVAVHIFIQVADGTWRANGQLLHRRSSLASARLDGRLATTPSIGAVSGEQPSERCYFEEIQVPHTTGSSSAYSASGAFSESSMGFRSRQVWEPVFIEYNGAPDCVSCGPMFGNLTESIRLCFPRKPEPSLQALDEHARRGRKRPTILSTMA